MRTSKSSLRSQFSEVTGSDVSVATLFLEQANYDLSKAIETYYNAKNSNKAVNKIDDKVKELYNKYKDSDDESIIDIQGTLQYLQDLDISPEDPKSLTLAFFLNSPSMGVFTKEDFLSRWSSEGINTISKMKIFIDNYHSQLTLESDRFKQIYGFAFDFLMENQNQKLLGYDIAIEYWKLLLESNINETYNDYESIKERLHQWYTFINEEHKRNISKDSWEMFYIFFVTILVKDPKSFGDYDEMSAWPSFIDGYVEYLKENSLLE